MESPKVSVIVAVYNAERTLRRCLDSLAAQTLREIEFVCIDDGSTDGSPSLLDQYAAHDSRFKVFHKDNSGVSATRQFGIEHICGEYVIHLDADDYAENTAYESLYKKAQADHSDITICDAIQIFDSGTNRMDYSASDLSASALIKRMFSWETSALWNRLIRTELIARYKLRFPDYLQLAEDRYFLVCLLSRSLQSGNSLKIAHLDQALIYYDTTANPASLTKSFSEKTVFTRMVDSYRILIPELDMSRFGKEFYSFILDMAFDAFWKFRSNDLDESDHHALFGSFAQGIKDYAPSGYRKTLVLLAFHKGIRFAEAFKWIALPTILLDKLKK